MGLLDRYGVNGEEQPREENAFAQRGVEAPHDKLAKMAIEDPFAETKTRIHNAIIEQQIASGETVTDESMRKLIDEYVESSFMMILWATAQSNALLTAMSILKLW